MPAEQLRFEFVDGSVELVRTGSPRYWELIEDGHTPVGSVPASDGISDALESYLAARFTASAQEATAGLSPRVDAVEGEVAGRLSDTSLKATFARMAPKPTGNATADTNALTALANSLADTGGVLRLHEGVYELNAGLPVLPGVIYQGVPPTLRQATVNSPAYLADGVWNYENGTVLHGDGTFAAFSKNTTDQASPQTDLGNSEIPGFGVIGIGFDNFTYGINVGAKDIMGLSHGILDQLHFKNCSQWGVRLVNFAHMTIGDMRACLCAVGGFFFGTNLAASVFQPGNSRMGELYVLIPGTSSAASRKARGIVFDARGTGGGLLNHLDTQRLQVNRFANALLSVSATFTSGSADIAVPSGSEFLPGMLVNFATTANGVTANRAYVVKSVSGNNIQVATSNYGTVVTASGSGSITLTTYGFANMEWTADANSRVQCSTYGNLDVEGYTSAGIYMERVTVTEAIMAALPATPLADIVLRDTTSSRISSTEKVIADIDSGSSTSEFSGAIELSRNLVLRGQFQDIARGSYGLQIQPGGGGSPYQGPDLEGRRDGMVYPNRGMAMRVYPRNSSTAFAGFEGGVITCTSASATTMTLPSITGDTVPGNSHIGLWFDFVNVGTATMTINTDGTQLFNKDAGKTSLTVAPDQHLRVVAVKDSGGALWWYAEAAVAIA